MRESLLIVAALLLAGCATAPDAPAAIADPLPAAPTFAEVPFEDHGATEGLLCAPPGGCQVVEPSSDIEVPTGQILRAIEATFTWTARDPSAPAFEVFLLTVDEEGDWSWEESENTYWTGTSPLSIRADLDDDEPVTYHLHARARHAPADGFRAGLSQDYHATGIATVVASGLTS